MAQLHLNALLTCGALLTFGWPQFAAAQQDTPRLGGPKMLNELRELRDSNQDIKQRGDALPVGTKSIAVTRASEEGLNAILRQSISTAAVIYGGPTGPGANNLDLPGLLKGIYGQDDRLNPGDPKVTAEQALAATATAALVSANKFIPLDGGKYFNLPSVNNLGGGVGLCTPDQAKQLGVPDERFYDEPNPAFCSGFKVGSDLVATAGHCISTQESCDQTRFVFGFAITPQNPHPEKKIPADSIYRCSKIVDGEFGGVDKSDWRVVKVDRPIKAPQVKLRSAGEPQLQPGDAVTVIGYPMGLPVKIASGATVRWLDKAFFVANLDTYEGNSGSAVFNAKSLLAGELVVEGVLVRGEDDFEKTSPCFASKRCPIDGCRGEDVTFASKVTRALDGNGANTAASH